MGAIAGARGLEFAENERKGSVAMQKVLTAWLCVSLTFSAGSEVPV